MNNRFRIIAALGTAVVLATFMLYVGLKGGDVQEPVLQAAELVSHHERARDQVVQVDGIAAGPVEGDAGERITFFLTDREGEHRTRVVYEGSVPDAFRVGRNVIVKGRLHGHGADRELRAEPGTLVTKCPSKFEAEDGGTARSSA